MRAQHEGDEGLGLLTRRAPGEHGDRVLGDNVVAIGYLDTLDLAAHRHRIGRIDEAGVRLAEHDLGQDGSHVRLLADDVRLHPCLEVVSEETRGGKLLEDLKGVAPHRNGRPGQHDLRSGPGQVDQAADPGSFGPRDDHELVAGENLIGVKEARRLECVHVGQVGRGEHVHGRTLLDLNLQDLAAREVKLDGVTGMRCLEGLRDLAQGIGEGGGRGHTQRFR